MRKIRIRGPLVFVLVLVPFLCAAALNDPGAKNPSGLPLNARLSISGALGRDLPDYHARASSNGFEAANPRQELTVHFGQESVEVGNGNSRWSLGLRGYGYGDALVDADKTAPRASFNRVEYRRGSLTEWYVNGPFGLEQGFTLQGPPSKAKGQPLTIALDMWGSLKPTVDDGGKGLVLKGVQGKALRYGGLSAHDASGRELTSRLEIKGRELLLQVADAGATYPIVVDPFLQLAELTASDGAPDDAFGISVSISGNTVVVGAEFATVGSNSQQGAAYIFIKPSSGWENMTQTAKLTASGGNAGDGFGGATAINGNGSIVVIGACPQTGTCNGPGSAYIFIRPSTGWQNTSTFAAKLTASDGIATDSFSNSLAITRTGRAVVVGAPGATINGNLNQGAAYVFVEPSGGWMSMTETAKLTSSDGAAGDGCGEVSVSGNGRTVFVGAPGAAIGSNAVQGAAYIFIEPATGWRTTSTFNAKLTASNGAAGDAFGLCQSGSVCISSDGRTVLVGAPQINLGPGKAYIYVEPAAGWATTSAFTAELTSSDGKVGDTFGWSVAITSKVGLIGAVGANGFQGAAYGYVKPTTGWKTTSTFDAKLTASDGGVGDAFGYSVAINGNTAAIGATNGAPSGSTGKNAAYVFGP